MPISRVHLKQATDYPKDVFVFYQSCGPCDFGDRYFPFDEDNTGLYHVFI